MLHIRRLQSTDSLEQLTALLHRGYAQLGAMGLNYTAVDQSVEVTADRIQGGHCFVALWSGELAGTVLGKPQDLESECEYFRRPGVASLRQLAVEPSLQGKGIGRALIAACESWARESGFAELALDTAEPASHLVAMYARLGFAQVDTVQWPGKCYRSVVMSKRLVGGSHRLDPVACYSRSGASVHCRPDGIQAQPREAPPLLRFRPLVAADQDRLWHWLHVALWDPPPAPLRPVEILQSPAVRIYVEDWGRETDCGVVAVVDGVDAGACWMRVLPAGTGLGSVDAVTPQLGMALEPEFQHKGHGKPLLREALACAARAGHARVALTVHPENPARFLYQSCGFEQVDVRHGYLLMVARVG